MRLCVHGKPTDRPDLCVGCCHLAYALGLVTREQVMEWHGDAIATALQTTGESFDATVGPDEGIPLLAAAASAAVLALVESDEARQAITDGLHDKDCGCDGPTDDYYDELADAAQAALVAYLKGESDD